MDIRQFLGIFSASSSTDHEIAESLKKNSQRLDRFSTASSSGRLKVETMTASEARQRQTEYQKNAESDEENQSDS